MGRKAISEGGQHQNCFWSRRGQNITYRPVSVHILTYRSARMSRPRQKLLTCNSASHLETVSTLETCVLETGTSAVFIKGHIYGCYGAINRADANLTRMYYHQASSSFATRCPLRLRFRDAPTCHSPRISSKLHVSSCHDSLSPWAFSWKS